MFVENQKLWWIDRRNCTEGYVVVVQEFENYFVVEYNGKMYKRPYDVVGKKLFLEPQLKKIRNCDNCFCRFSGSCTSLTGIVCDDFIARQKISQEEIDLWPEYGDATAYKLRDYKHFR